MEKYHIEFIIETHTSSPQKAVRNALFRISDSAVSARVTNVTTGDVYTVHLYRGQIGTSGLECESYGCVSCRTLPNDRDELYNTVD